MIDALAREIDSQTQDVRRKRDAFEGHRRTPTELEAAVAMHEISQEAAQGADRWERQAGEIGADAPENDERSAELRRRALALAQEYRALAGDARDTVAEHVQGNPVTSRETYAAAARSYAAECPRPESLTPAAAAFLGRILSFETIIAAAPPGREGLGRQVTAAATSALHEHDAAKARAVVEALRALPGFAEAESRVRALAAAG